MSRFDQLIAVFAIIIAIGSKHQAIIIVNPLVILLFFILKQCPDRLGPKDQVRLVLSQVIRNGQRGNLEKRQERQLPLLRVQDHVLIRLVIDSIRKHDERGWELRELMCFGDEFEEALGLVVKIILAPKKAKT